MPHRRLNLWDAAAYLHLSALDLEELVRRQEIPFERQGDRVVFAKKEVDAWASQRILGLPRQRLASYHQKTSTKAHDLSKSRAIIRELLKKDFLDPALASKTKQSVLRDMIALAEGTGLVNYPEELLASLQEREKLCSTGLPNGPALLHARHQDLYMFADSFIVAAKAVHSVPFGAPDGGLTDLFFLMCCQDDRLHLHVLARLCMMCGQTKMIARLREAADAEAMFNVIAESEEQVIKQL